MDTTKNIAEALCISSSTLRRRLMKTSPKRLKKTETGRYAWDHISLDIIALWNYEIEHPDDIEVLKRLSNITTRLVITNYGIGVLWYTIPDEELNQPVQKSVVDRLIKNKLIEPAEDTMPHTFDNHVISKDGFNLLMMRKEYN